MKKLHYIYLASAWVLSGCEGFLDAKPEQSLVVPHTLDDVQALLDNTVVFNVQPSIPYLAADEFEISDAGFTALATPQERGVYLWEDDPYQGQPVADWTRLYQQVFYANVALQTLEGSPDKGSDQYNHLKGSALFYRAYAYHQLLQVFAMPYLQSGDNSKTLGIVLRDRADINAQPKRASLEDSYRQLVSDLEMALALLPDSSVPKTRPSRAAALGLMSRVLMDTFQFRQAAESAEKALGIYVERVDFNTLNLSLPRPFTAFNGEMVFYSSLLTNGFMRSAEASVDSALIASYGPADLRKQAYFIARAGGKFTFSKFLTGTNQFFGGISVGELYLTAAEGFFRSGDEEKARDFLNRLLALRYKTGFFEPVVSTGQVLLDRIVMERRKELVGRGLRWADIRRLNQWEGSKTTLQRSVLGQEYQLLPGSAKYAFPIPDEELARSGILQNPR
ncbi:RagB/SusD family nutrient uptake outer membrane protein [Algoriphagus sp. H41]|uniref:RagB/SusD family nutrient uptake outer membrane protein n=1 Tax=Algoriphagus oliviformis TaxID=2811231 RepID=A0ABS3CAA7_9BACT|nr:RagB/SusD family nutrient uptake outer membrane protein [Algoriphagus oliviformis]MBN7813091.1 RagB/SusD family nutrient uptake outer membrane protein [Algoriphagus oliviformis]